MRKKDYLCTQIACVMGTYINIGNAGFQRARNSEYVDKSMLISVVNKTLFTERQLLQDTLDGEDEAVPRAIDAAPATSRYVPKSGALKNDRSLEAQCGSVFLYLCHVLIINS